MKIGWANTGDQLESVLIGVRNEHYSKRIEKWSGIKGAYMMTSLKGLYVSTGNRDTAGWCQNGGLTKRGNRGHSTAIDFKFSFFLWFSTKGEGDAKDAAIELKFIGVVGTLAELVSNGVGGNMNGKSSRSSSTNGDNDGFGSCFSSSFAFAVGTKMCWEIQ